MNRKLLCCHHFRGYCNNLYQLVCRVPPILSFGIDLYVIHGFLVPAFLFITVAYSFCWLGFCLRKANSPDCAELKCPVASHTL